MRPASIVTLLIVMGAKLWGQPGVSSPHGTVIVCVERTDTRVGPGVVRYARQTASRIFARIGVSIEWRAGLTGCPEQGIQISLNNRSPEWFKPGALAYALPYEGTHICVLYDRVAGNLDPLRASFVLGHVFAHEITHILQGTVRHSSSGLMKARWNDDDLERMIRQRPLKFAPEDVGLIYRGIARREGQVSVARSQIKAAAPGVN